MSQEITQFVVIPNEVIYYIFDFLSTLDILRAFTQLTRRYDDLIRFYIDRIDLTDGRQSDYHQLQWISETIQILKVDQHHIHFLSDYQFRQLHSLSLVDVLNWQDVVSRMNLKNLCLWFNNKNRYYIREEFIPNTVVRFSTNARLQADAYHNNLIYLNVDVPSIMDIIKIVKHTPKVQHLHVTFTSGCFINCDAYLDKRWTFRALNSGIGCLTNLQNLSIRATHSKHPGDYYGYSTIEESWLLNHIQLFIDRCCPNTTILKRVTLQFDHIKPGLNFWSTFERYKKTFDRFDFYVSIIKKGKISNIIKIPSTLGHWGFHIEGTDHTHCVHIYSLPFVFDNLHGFTSCSALNAPSSFSSVRCLYFSRAPLIRSVSFQSLTTSMPRLTSIDFHSTVHEFPILLKLNARSEIFDCVKSLGFVSYCPIKSCTCHNLLPRLVDRMPTLRSLTTSNDAFTRGQQPLLPMKILDEQQNHLDSLETLSEHLPYLSALVLGQLRCNEEKLSRILGCLFIGIPSLRFLSFKISHERNLGYTRYEQIAQRALVLALSMESRLEQLNVELDAGLLIFSRQNS